MRKKDKIIDCWVLITFKKWHSYLILSKAERTLQKIGCRRCRKQRMGQMPSSNVSSGHNRVIALTIALPLWLNVHNLYNRSINITSQERSPQCPILQLRVVWGVDILLHELALRNCPYSRKQPPTHTAESYSIKHSGSHIRGKHGAELSENKSFHGRERVFMGEKENLKQLASII